MNNVVVLEVRVVAGAVLAVAEAIPAPSVAVGILASLTPSIASAVADRAANPTEGGLYRNTEYTFFSEIILMSAHVKDERRMGSAY